jgi:hypothetical protein
MFEKLVRYSMLALTPSTSSSQPSTTLLGPCQDDSRDLTRPDAYTRGRKPCVWSHAEMNVEHSSLLRGRAIWKTEHTSFVVSTRQLLVFIVSVRRKLEQQTALHLWTGVIVQYIINECSRPLQPINPTSDTDLRTLS